jgi:hypothetical protein
MAEEREPATVKTRDQAAERHEAIKDALPDAAKVTALLVTVLSVVGLKSDQVAQVVRSYVWESIVGLSILALGLFAATVIPAWVKYRKKYPGSNKRAGGGVIAASIPCALALVGGIYGAVTSNGQVSKPSIDVTVADGAARIEVSAVNLQNTNAAVITAHSSCESKDSYDDKEILVDAQAGPDATGVVRFVATVPLAGAKKVHVHVNVPANSSHWTTDEEAETCVRIVAE